MHPASKPVLAAVTAAAIAAGAAACSSPASSKGAGTGFAAVKPASASASAGRPLAAESAGAIISTAVADTEAASSVRMTGAGADAGQGIAFDLTLARGQGCEGTISTSATESFQVVYQDQTVWMKPSNAFYASLGNSDKAALSALEGKYIKVSATNSLIGNISQLCSLNGLLGTVGPQAGKDYAAASATYDGRPAIKMTQAGHPGYAYVSATAKPVVLAVSAPGSSGGSITFTDYNAPVTITPPPAAQTIDGSQFGL